MNTDIEIHVKSDPKLLASLRGLVRSYLTRCGISEDRAGEAVLAVDEACANSIRHAYGGRTDQVLHIIFQATETYVEIAVCDGGETASPDCVSKKEVTPPDPATVEPGGLGVPLIHTVFDEVEFKPGTPHGNCVFMRLMYEAPGTAEN